MTQRRKRSFYKKRAGDEGMSREQIAAVLGVSAARVGQIEEQALEKLRRALARLDIREAH